MADEMMVITSLVLRHQFLRRQAPQTHLKSHPVSYPIKSLDRRHSRVFLTIYLAFFGSNPQEKYRTNRGLHMDQR